MGSPQSSSTLRNNKLDAAYFSSSSDSLEPINHTISPLIQWLNNNCNVTDDGHPVQHLIPTVVAQQNMDILDRHRYQYRSTGRTVDDNTGLVLQNSILGALSYTNGNLENISPQPSTSEPTLTYTSPVSTVTEMECNGHVEVKTSKDQQSQQSIGISDGDHSSTPTIPLRAEGSIKTKKFTTRKVNNDRSSAIPQKITNRRVHVSTPSYTSTSSSSSINVVGNSKALKIQIRSRRKLKSKESSSSDSSDTDDNDEETSSDLSVQSTNSLESDNTSNSRSRKNLNNAQNTGGKKSVAVNRRKKRNVGHNFHKAIGLTLRKMNNQDTVTHSSIQIANDFVSDMFVRISSEASNLMRLSRRKTMTARDIQFAVKLVLPKNLGDCADQVGQQALLRYANSE